MLWQIFPGIPRHGECKEHQLVRVGDVSQHQQGSSSSCPPRMGVLRATLGCGHRIQEILKRSQDPTSTFKKHNKTSSLFLKLSRIRDSPTALASPTRLFLLITDWSRRPNELPHASSCPVHAGSPVLNVSFAFHRFAKLLLRLPALRSIGLKCLEHLFFFKLIGDTPIDTFLMEMLETPLQIT